MDPGVGLPEGMWGQAGAPGAPGGAPRSITCLDPLVELQGLQALELLSPLMPVTDSGLDFLFIKDEQQGEAAADVSSKGSKGSTVVYKPALPALNCLALSGGSIR